MTKNANNEFSLNDLLMSMFNPSEYMSDSILNGLDEEVDMFKKTKDGYSIEDILVELSNKMVERKKPTKTRPKRTNTNKEYDNQSNDLKFKITRGIDSNKKEMIYVTLELVKAICNDIYVEFISSMNIIEVQWSDSIRASKKDEEVLYYNTDKKTNNKTIALDIPDNYIVDKHNITVNQKQDCVILYLPIEPKVKSEENFSIKL